MSDLIKEFYELAKDTNFNVLGLLTSDYKILTLGSDSKLIGRIFELISKQLLQKICVIHGWTLEGTESQTTYPDFTISKKEGNKIAVDIKTTYRRYNKHGVSKFGFTLGSFASFLRNNTKNIAYPYNQYDEHYVIGFVYDRVEDAIPGDMKKLTDKILPPYNNVEFFIQEKYKIAGEKPGSGNTENIGSFLSTQVSDFVEGNGPFSKLGNVVFENYWKHYPKYREIDKIYTSLEEYFKYYGIDYERDEKGNFILKDRPPIIMRSPSAF